MEQKFGWRFAKPTESKRYVLFTLGHSQSCLRNIRLDESVGVTLNELRRLNEKDNPHNPYNANRFPIKKHLKTLIIRRQCQKSLVSKN